MLTKPVVIPEATTHRAKRPEGIHAGAWSITKRADIDLMLKKTCRRFSAVTFLTLAVWSFHFLGCSGTRSARVGESTRLSADTSGIHNNGTDGAGLSPVAPPEYRIGI